MSDETRLDGDASQAAGGPATTRRRVRPSRRRRPARQVPGPELRCAARRGRRRRTLLAVGLGAVIVGVGGRVRRDPRHDAGSLVPDPGRARRLVRRPALGRGAAGRDPARAARTRRSTRATCSTPRWRCGTRGRPTTRRRTATSTRPRSTAGDVAAARDEAISYAAYRVLLGPVHQGGRRRRLARRVRGRHGRAVLPGDGQHDRGRHAGRASATASRPPSSPTAWRTARTRPTATRRRTTRRSTTRWSSTSPGPR